MEESGEEDSTQGLLGGLCISARNHQQPPPPAGTVLPIQRQEDFTL